MTNIKNQNKPPDGVIVYLHPVRLIYIIHVFLYQEKKEVSPGKCLVKRQICSQDKNLALSMYSLLIFSFFMMDFCQMTMT